MKLQEEIKCIKRINSSSLIFCPLYVPLGPLLLSCPWVPEWVWERGKKKKQCCTWQAIIAPLQMYHQWDGWRGRACPATHINTHTHRQWIVSLPRESKCWVSKSKQTLQLRTLEAPVSALHAQETKNGGGHHNCRPNLRCGVQWWWLGASLTLGDTCWTHFISCSFEMNGSVM